MTKAFERVIEGLLPDRGTALFAVSGGIDSMCMASLAYGCGIPMAIAHCNFHLRGEESDADASMVRDWAGSRGIRFHHIDFDTESYAREHAVSIEMAARELRYSWFGTVCRENGYEAVAVAHNANDNAETLMLNLLRGTGLKGLCGMNRDTVIPLQEAFDVRLIRPMLGFSRAEIEEYAASENVPYREDRTNGETVYKRNKLRHLVLPVFEEINPSFLDTFSREMAVFSQENEIAEEYFLLAYGRVMEQPLPGEVFRINLDALLAERHWEYVLFRLLRNYGFRDRLLEPVARLLSSGGTVSGRSFESPGFRLVTIPGKLVLYKVEFAPATGFSKVTLSENTACSIVRTSGRYEFDNFRFESSLEKAGPECVSRAKELAGQYVLAADAAALPMPFVARGWRNGDWMRPMGLKGKRKLSDIFSDLKMGLADKANALVLVSPSLSGNGDEKAGEHIAAVCGYVSGSFFCRVDESVKVTPSTSDIVKISLFRIS